MKPLHKVIFTLKDRGCEYPNQTKEVVLKEKETVETALKSQLNKYRKAMNLSAKFEFTVTDSTLIGYAK